MTSELTRLRVHQRHRGLPPCYEYILPVAGSIISTWRGISKWTREFAPLTPEAAHELFRKSSRVGPESCCSELEQELLMFRPESVVLCENDSWLLTAREP